MASSSIAQAQENSTEVLRWFTALTDVALRTSSEAEHGIFIAEGETVIRRAHAAGYQLLALLAEPRFVEPLSDITPESASVIVDSQDALRELTGYHVHRGALAAFQRKPLPEPDTVMRSARVILFIEGMVNHTNVGAIFRSAAAMRVDAILIDNRCADPLYRRAIRTSMGTVFQLPWTRASLEDLEGVTKIALTPSTEARDIRRLDWEGLSPFVLLVGTEGEGLTQEALNRCDLQVTIPMHGGIDSLNAAAATAVACYEITRNRP